MNRLKSLDGLRGIIALVLAFLFHYYCSFSANPLGISNVERLSTLAYLFFLISGFGLFLNCRQQVTQMSIARFMLKRVSKWYPLFLATTFCTAILIYISRLIVRNLDFTGTTDNLYHLLLNVILIHSGVAEDGQSFNTPAWFLGVLVINYFIFYCVERSKLSSKYVFYVLWTILGIYVVHHQPSTVTGTVRERRKPKHCLVPSCQNHLSQRQS